MYPIIKAALPTSGIATNISASVRDGPKRRCVIVLYLSRHITHWYGSRICTQENIYSDVLTQLYRSNSTGDILI